MAFNLFRLTSFLFYKYQNYFSDKKIVFILCFRTTTNTLIIKLLA